MFDRIKALQQGLNEILSVSQNIVTSDKLIVDGVYGPKTQAMKEKLFYKLRNTLSDKFKDYILIGIRMSDDITNKFSDWGLLIHGDDMTIFPMSTKPGLKYTQSPMNANGTAVLKEGYYPRVWKYSNDGWSKYPHLKQIGNKVTVFRDGNKDLKIDRKVTDVGYFGINFHSWAGFTSAFVGSLSAGCQVVQVEIMEALLPYLQKMDKQYGFIDYTLINIKEL